MGRGVGKERDVRVTLPAEVRNQPGALANLPLIQRGDRMLTLQQVATLDRAEADDDQSVDRSGWRRSGRAAGVPLGTATEDATAAMNAGAAGRDALGAGRDRRGAAEPFTALIFGLAASIVLMYLVLTVLYESWLQPALILTALPLASVGAFLGLLVFGQTLSVPSFIGFDRAVRAGGEERDPAGGPGERPAPSGMSREAALERPGRTACARS